MYYAWSLRIINLLVLSVKVIASIIHQNFSYQAFVLKLQFYLTV